MGFPSKDIQVTGAICDRLVDYFDGNDTVEASITGTVNRTLARTLAAATYLSEDFVFAYTLEHKGTLRPH